ncbi:hypothetical protein [Streptomyces sp. STR69]|uniref:hypothetical protein n=1 Tax=Streptomyces sp. STR69 TaxID=1796942 RepID=UPI0021C61160|nr:hypothetical protein [Streptomyces sp. STR69]
MVHSEIGSELVRLASRVADTARREREAGPAEKATRVRVAANTRDEAIQYLAQACATLEEWPSPACVGAEAADAVMTIFKASQAQHMRVLLPLLDDAAKKNRISKVCVAEATDALCAAEQRPQVYGTILDYPVADAARLDTLRAQVGLPLLNPTVKQASVPPPAPALSLKQFPDGFDVLKGLLTDLPAVSALPRVVRPTVGSGEPWGCAYCCGKADPGSTELDIKGRVWRICPLCEKTEDTPQGRLMDVLLAVGNVSEATARATMGVARDQSWRVPLRYEDSRARPNHRPQPRWANVPAVAIAKLVAYAEQYRSHPHETATPPAPTQRVRADNPTPPRRNTQPLPSPHSAAATTPGATVPSPVVWDGSTWRSSLLKSKRAIDTLTWPPSTPLTRLQVSQALQIGEGNLDRNGMEIHTVAALLRVFADPPQWLRDFHDARARERAANYVWQTGQPTEPITASPPNTAWEADPSPSPGDVPAPRDARRMPLLPHPEVLISARAAQAMTQPATTPLRPGVAAKLLQIAFTTMQKNNLTVPTIGHLTAVLHDPPPWLLVCHRKLAAANRIANAVRS